MTKLKSVSDPKLNYLVEWRKIIPMKDTPECVEKFRIKMEKSRTGK